MSVERIQQHFRDSAALKLEVLEALSAPIAAAVDTLFGAFANGNRILACGEGGSAALARMAAAAMLGRFERERPALPAIALSTDTALLSGIGVDYPHDELLARQVSALGQPGDVLIVVSASADAPSIAMAIDAAHEREMFVVALIGKDDSPLASTLAETDIGICVPGERPMRVEEVHLLTIHCLCDGIDAMLLGED